METEDSFRILVLTDNHMGYNIGEDKIKNVRKINFKENLIEKDSFEAVEEILAKAKEEKVDFVIQGGDLYHHANPTLEIIHRGMETFSNTVYGKKEHDFTIKNMDPSCTDINIDNQNINIAVPVFSIHGNHDYPTNSNWESVLQILKTSGLINYFGRHRDLDFLTFRPICFVKKTASGKKIGVALYGLGNMQHSKLRNILKERKYSIIPPEDSNEVSYTSIMVMHQNRYKGTGMGASKNHCIEFRLLPKEIDLFIWGHEHDCYTEFEPIHGGDSFVYQPGSSIPTSFTEGEAKKKHFGILNWNGQGRIVLERAVELKSQRHIEFESLDFDDISLEIEKKEKEIDPNFDIESREGEFVFYQRFEDFLRKKIRNMIVSAIDRRGNTKLPFIRLRVTKCPKNLKKEVFDPKKLEEEFKYDAANQ